MCPSAPAAVLCCAVQSLVTLLWALATLRASQHQPLLRAVTQQLASRLEASMDGPSSSSSKPAGGASSSSSSSIDGDSGDGAWYAGSSSSSSSSRLAAAAAATIEEGLPVDQLSTAVWACGQLRHSDPQLLDLAAGLLHGRVDQMAPGDVARWAGASCHRSSVPGSACWCSWPDNM